MCFHWCYWGISKLLVLILHSFMLKYSCYCYWSYDSKLLIVHIAQFNVDLVHCSVTSCSCCFFVLLVMLILLLLLINRVELVIFWVSLLCCGLNIFDDLSRWTWLVVAMLLCSSFWLCWANMCSQGSDDVIWIADMLEISSGHCYIAYLFSLLLRRLVLRFCSLMLWMLICYWWFVVEEMKLLFEIAAAIFFSLLSSEFHPLKRLGNEFQTLESLGNSQYQVYFLYSTKISCISHLSSILNMVITEISSRTSHLVELTQHN